jgi:hypothetical protein
VLHYYIGSTLLTAPIRYGSRLISFGEYTSEQFYIVFIATIFSGESAAAFFQYGTSESLGVGRHLPPYRLA